MPDKSISPIEKHEGLYDSSGAVEDFFNQNFYKLIGSLLAIRSSAQSIKRCLDDSREKIVSKSDYSVNDEEKIYTYNKEIISKKLDEIDNLLSKCPELEFECADEIIHIKNYWKCLEYHWPNFTQKKEIHLEDIEKCSECICELIFHCNIITIPPRINNHLDEYHPGQTLDFYTSFRDEVCDEKQSNQIMEYLSKFPKCINGYIDLKSGLVYKAALPKKQKYSCFRILAVIVIGALLLPAVLAYMSENLLSNSIDFFNCYLQLIIVYAFIIAGAASHIGLDSVKQIRSGDSNVSIRGYLAGG